MKIYGTRGGQVLEILFLKRVNAVKRRKKKLILQNKGKEKEERDERKYKK